jgi:hypothetical protein
MALPDVPAVPDENELAERLKGKTKQVVGAVVRDDDLRAEGELQTKKADAVAQARSDAEEAARESAKADIETRANELRTERAEVAAERAEAAERARLERAEAEAEARINKAAQAQEAAVQRQAAAQRTALDASNARAVHERLEAEAEAHRLELAAERAKRTAATLGQSNLQKTGALVSQIATLPRVAFTGALDALRLPLSTVEKLSGQADNPAWPPAMLFADFQAGAKQFAGAFFGDRVLAQEGRLQSARVSELRRAIALDEEARATRQQAEATLTEERQAAERARQKVAADTRTREQAVAARTRAEEAKVAAEAEQARETVAKIDDNRAQRLAETERSTRLANADVETVALGKQKQALTSIEQVAQLDKAVEAKKRQRKKS